MAENPAMHEPSMVLELVGRAPSYGWYCLSCSKPWPCPDAPRMEVVR